MYLLTGVRSKFYHLLQNYAVKNYMEDGYKAGREVSYWIFDEKEFQIKGQIFNLERERLADEWLKKEIRSNTESEV